MIEVGNLFANVPLDLQAEQIDELLTRRNLKIARIVSRGQASPPGFWYDQDDDEWVILLTGSAGLRFELEEAAKTLSIGDYVHIPAHTRHRVEWTDPSVATIWLAIHHS
jgi:cupin 2 domain-containing protein